MTATPPPSVNAPWAGGDVTARAYCVLAPNPGPMTLDGTNTWVLLEPGGDRAVVVDPGPLDEGHLAAGAAGRAVAWRPGGQVLLTHGHLDHSGGRASIRRAGGTGARVRALDPAYRLGSRGSARATW